MEAFLADRQALASEMMELIDSEASPEDIRQWWGVNATRHQALVDAAANIASIQARPELPFVEEVQLPAGASEAMGDFLVNRAELHNSWASHLNRLRDVTKEQRHQALEAWGAQNSAALEVRRQLDERISDEQSVGELEFPASVDIPPGASPELEAFLN